MGYSHPTGSTSLVMAMGWTFTATGWTHSHDYPRPTQALSATISEAMTWMCIRMNVTGDIHHAYVGYNLLPYRPYRVINHEVMFQLQPLACTSKWWV